MMTSSHSIPSACTIDESLASSIGEARLGSLARTYFWQGEFLAMPGLLPPALVDALVADVDRVRAAAVRRQLPAYKGSSSVAWPALQRGAPSIAGLFHSRSFRGLVEEVADARLVAAPDWDPHACAVYHYDREGDGIGYHYDTSWYRGARYTVLVGLVNRSTAVLSCDLHTREPQRPRRTVEIATEPGTVVVFHGDKVWHRVTPLGPGEVRTVLTLQYVTDPRMSAVGRAVSFAKDAVAYFGVRQAARALFARPGPRALPAGASQPRAATP